MNETTSTFVGDDAIDEIDGPFLESIEYDPDPSPSPIIKPTIRKQLNLDSYAPDETPGTVPRTTTTTTKPPMQVKFSDSTHDVRSVSSDANRSSAAASSVSASEALDFEFNMVIDIESGKCTLHSGGAQDSTDSSAAAKYVYFFSFYYFLSFPSRIYVRFQIQFPSF